MKATFKIDPQLTHILGESYRSSEKAVKELVDNAWDADATKVEITLPDYMKTNDPIIICDNGCGMSEQSMREGYLLVASDKRKRQGERIKIYNRQVKGRKGIGKFAGLLVANEMSIVSVVGSYRTELSLSKKTLLESECHFDEIELPFLSKEKDPLFDTVGTTVTLSDLNQSLAYPSTEVLSNLLLVEYGHSQNFDLYINGILLKSEHLAGENCQKVLSFSEDKVSDLNFTITEKNIKQSGIVLKVNGKVVGKPTYFGLDEDEEIPKKLLKRVYGEVSADHLEGVVTSDWEAFIENSKDYQELVENCKGIIKDQLYTKFTNEINLTKARLQHKINQELAKLPENRREYATKAIDKVLEKFYGEADWKKEAIISVVIESLERDDYFSVIEKIHEARHGEISELASALSEFGLLEMSIFGRQAKHRLSVLDDLDSLIFNDETRESEIHQALENNLWVLGSEFGLISSDKTLKSLVKDKFGEDFDDEERSKKRPDLLLMRRFGGNHVLIEFKRPKVTINWDHVSQAARYRDDLSLTVGDDIEVLVIGKQVDPKMNLNTLPQRLSVLSFTNVISKAREELNWMLENLKS